MAVALVLVRGMMLETVRDPFAVQPGSDPVPRGPGPATGVVLNLLSCVPALLVLVRGALDRTYVIRRSWAQLLMLVLGVWTMLSPIWASDKFIALIGAVHWLSALVLLWSASQLVRGWAELRLVAAAAFGLLLVMTAHGVIWRLVELPDLRQQVEQDWPRIVQERGWEIDSYIAQRFKQRVMAGEMIGFNASPNTFGAMTVMLALVTAGLALQRIDHRDEYGWPLVLLLSLVPAGWILTYTNSRTALATPVLGAGIFVVAWLARDVIIRNRKLVFIASVALIAILAAAAVGHALYHGTLFHESLTFRWNYWIGAARIFEQHPLVGIGYANFGLHYLGARVPEAAEEINDPHNLVVRIVVELGLVGGILLIAWMIRLWWEMTRPVVPALREPRAIQPARADGSLAQLLQLAAATAILSTVATIDFAQPLDYVLVEVLKRLLYMLLLMIGLVVGTIRSTHEQRPDDRPAPLLLYAMLVAIGIFLVHNLVDFSLFETGPMFMFALLVGAIVGIRQVDARPMRRTTIGISLLLALVVWIAGAIGLAAPVVLAEREAHAGDAALRAGSPAAAAVRYRSALETLWIPNPDYAYRAARAMILAGAAPERVRAMLGTAIHASPMSVASWRLAAEFELRQPSPDARRVIEHFSRVVELDPNDVSTRLDYAEALERLGRLDEARGHYARALRSNELLDPAEPERLTPARVEEIERKIGSLDKSAP